MNARDALFDAISPEQASWMLAELLAVLTAKDLTEMLERNLEAIRRAQMIIPWLKAQIEKKLAAAAAEVSGPQGGAAV